MAKGKKASKAAAGKDQGGGSAGKGFSSMDVDPRRIRFAHSRIKPTFSGCGRSIEETLEEIRAGKTAPSDLPMITVILGPVDKFDGQQWFFSLNNRRLFVFKVCREEGLLGLTGLVRVRARSMKVHERDRYTLERCALQAKFMFVPKPAATEGFATNGTQPGEDGDAGEIQTLPSDQERNIEESADDTD